MASVWLTYIEFCIFIEDLGFFANACFGFILIYLSVFKIKRQFGSYKYLLINFQVLGLVFATHEFFFHTILHNFDASLIWISFARPLNLSNSAIETAMSIYAGLYCATISQITVQFIYRYWAIFDTKKLKYFEGFYYLIWVSYTTSTGGFWATSVRNFNELDDFGTEYLREEVLVKFERNITDMPMLAMIGFEGNGDIRWRGVYGTLVMTGIFFIQYSVIGLCAYHMCIAMRTKVAKFSQQQQRLHRQFFRALIIQITAPTLVLFSPVFFMIYAPFLNLKFSFPSCIIQSGFTIYPAIDSIFIMTCVSEYGRSIKNIFCKTKIIGSSVADSSAAGRSKGGSIETVTQPVTNDISTI